jgi:hypothetical protein
MKSCYRVSSVYFHVHDTHQRICQTALLQYRENKISSSLDQQKNTRHTQPRKRAFTAELYDERLFLPLASNARRFWDHGYSPLEERIRLKNMEVDKESYKDIKLGWSLVYDHLCSSGDYFFHISFFQMMSWERLTSFEVIPFLIGNFISFYDVKLMNPRNSCA